MNYFAIFLVFFAVEASAQLAFPRFSEQPVWNVLETYPFSGISSAHTFRADTQICGQSYSIYNPGNKDFFIRADSQKAYVRYSTNCTQAERILYDYSKNAGDTFFIANFGFVSNSDSLPMRVQKIEKVKIGADSLFQHTIQYSPVGDFNFLREMKWIKSVGSLMHPFFNFICLADRCERSAQLLCFSKNRMQVYQNEKWGKCDISYGNIGIQNHSKANFSLSPNPIRSKFHINMQYLGEKTLQILDLLGKEVFHTRFSGISLEIDAQSWPSGLYWVQMEMGNERFFQKILKE